ncbi:glycosyltransferase [Thalassospira alkalitolerans]|uniref:glycosyltransferase n=1 Tax=Thalassospira alkalitolerans TaxID=1293890 RepID=UPI0030EBE746|tara:strand:- start:43729 stop:44748 length:1020 start_codon:yes stop_codon:yes gene_type:complete
MLFQTMAGSAFGGAEEFFVRLACGFQRAGVDQFCAIRPNEGRNTVLSSAGVSFSELPFGGRLDIRTPFILRRLLKQHKPRIVLSWMNRASRMTPSGDFVKVARLGGYYKLKNFRDCDHLIGNTRDIVEYMLREGWPAERAHYLPNFVDAVPGEPINRSEFNTPDDVPLILGLGRLHENKGFDNLIRALASVPDAYLWIAGTGDLKGDLLKLACEMGVADRVRLLGWRRDVGNLFASCDVFCASSRHEPLGNMVIEAWAHGTPVVAQASQGPVQLIKHGESGLLSPLENVDALGRDLRAVLDEPALAKTLSSNGREIFISNFTEDVVVTKYRAFFDEVAR